MSHQLLSKVVGWSRLSVVILYLWGLTVLASERQYSKLRERGNRWMGSAVAEDGARATLSENRYKTAGGGKCVIVNRAKACSVWSLETTSDSMGGSVTGVDGGRRRPMDVKTDGVV